MKIPFVLWAVFGMLFIASAPLNRCCDQYKRTVYEQEYSVNCGHSTHATRIPDSICSSHE